MSDLGKITKSKWWRAYVKFPVNLSTLTGIRYPGIPRLKGNFLLGRLTYLFKENGVLNNTIEAGKLAANHPSGMCYFWIGPQLAILITNLDDIYQLKVKCAQNLSTDLPLLEKFAGPSIFTNDWEIWHKKRNVCLKATSMHALEKLESGMKQVIENYIKELDVHSGNSINVRIFAFNFVVDMVTTNLMGCKDGASKQLNGNVKIDQLSPLSEYLSEATRDVLMYRNVFKWMLPEFIRKLFFRHEPNDFEDIKRRMKEHYDKIFIQPNKENILSSGNLLEEIWTMNHAGHDGNYKVDEIFSDGLFLTSAGVATTVATIEFIIKLLAAHPEVTQKLRAEIFKLIPKGDPITMNAVSQIFYLDMVINETMRLYPPVPLLFPRKIASYTEVGGVPLHKGDMPIISTYFLHRSPDLWEEPERFNPERFSKENIDKIPKHAFMPFSIGPRFCAGQQFALQEMKLLLTYLYSRYEIDVSNNLFETSLNQAGLAPKIPPIAYFKTLR